MANDALKAAVQKEMLRRQAAAELQRRQQASGQAPQAEQPQAPASKPDGWLDTAFRLTPMGMAKDLFGAVTNPMGAMQTVDDSVRTLANGMSFGFADKLAAKMSGEKQLSDLVTGETPLSRERAKSEAAKARLGTTGDAVEMVGMMAPTTKLAQMGVTASRIPGMVGKYGGLLIDSTALGALDAAGHDRSIAEGAGVGLLAGAAGQALGKGAEFVYNKMGKGLAMKAMREAAPSFDDVKAMKNAKYKTLQDADVKFDANSYQRVLQDTSDALKNYRATKAPYTADTVNYMKQFDGMSPTFSDIEDILKEAKGTLRDSKVSDTDKAASRIVVEKLSAFFDNAPLITNGSLPAGEVAKTAAEARELARRNILAKDVIKMQDKAEWYTSGGESGLRNQFAAYGKKNGARLLPAEQEAAKKVLLREGLLSGLNQTGTKLGQLVLGGAGAALGGLYGMAAATGTHLAARKASEKYTEKAVNDYLKTVLAGKAAQSQAARQAALKALSPAQKKAMETMLRAGSVGLLGMAAQ